MTVSYYYYISRARFLKETELSPLLNSNILPHVGGRCLSNAKTDEGEKGIEKIPYSKISPHPALRATLSLQGEG